MVASFIRETHPVKWINISNYLAGVVLVMARSATGLQKCLMDEWKFFKVLFIFDNNKKKGTLIHQCKSLKREKSD